MSYMMSLCYLCFGFSFLLFLSFLGLRLVNPIYGSCTVESVPQEKRTVRDFERYFFSYSILFWDLFHSFYSSSMPSSLSIPFHPSYFVIGTCLQSVADEIEMIHFSLALDFSGWPSWKQCASIALGPSTFAQYSSLPPHDTGKTERPSCTWRSKLLFLFFIFS